MLDYATFYIEKKKDDCTPKFNENLILGFGDVTGRNQRKTHLFPGGLALFSGWEMSNTNDCKYQGKICVFKEFLQGKSSFICYWMIISLFLIHFPLRNIVQLNFTKVTLSRSKDPSRVNIIPSKSTLGASKWSTYHLPVDKIVLKNRNTHAFGMSNIISLSKFQHCYNPC